jgi:hypothetical protein
MNDEWYSNFLHQHVRQWALQVPTDPPIIIDTTSPYPKLTVIETLTWRDTEPNHSSAPHHYTEIALVTLNGLYSYTLNFQWRTRGRGYLPHLKFCDPYPTKADALAAAIADLKRADPPREMLTWINDLAAPKQLTLF